MLKTLTALAFAVATVATPALAQDGEKVVKAPVAPVQKLSGSGLKSAAVVGGVALIGIGVIALIASNDDDDTTPNTPTNGT